MPLDKSENDQNSVTLIDLHILFTCDYWHCMENLRSFKSVMQRYYCAALEKTYECDDPRTFKNKTLPEMQLSARSARTLTEPYVFMSSTT